MKYNYLRYGVLALLAAVGTVSCSDDDTMVKPEPSPVVNPALPEHPELSLSMKSVDMLVDETKSIEILDGAGDYKLSVLDAAYAEATLTGSTIQLKGLKYGSTDLVISDQGGSYTTLTVNVYKSNELTTSVAEGSMKLTLPMGQPTTGSFTITAGNDPYTVESSDPQTVSASIDSENGTIVRLASSKGQEEGAAPVVITVTDARGLKAEISVTTEASDSPFTEEQLEQIKAINKRTYVFDGEELTDESKMSQHVFGIKPGIESKYHWGIYIMTTSTNLKSYYYYCLRSTELIDMKTVGKKTGNDFIVGYSYPTSSGSTWAIARDENRDLNVEVIKAENNMSWITFYVYDKYTDDFHTGYMVLPWE